MWNMTCLASIIGIPPTCRACRRSRVVLSTKVIVAISLVHLDLYTGGNKIQMMEVKCEM